MPDQDKRVALVSGANRGLGFAISQGLAEHEITVIIRSISDLRAERQ